MFVITPFFVTLAVVPPFWNHLGTKHPPTPPFGDEINSTPQTFNMSLLFALQRETYPFPRPQFGEIQQPVNQGQRAFGWMPGSTTVGESWCITPSMEWSCWCLTESCCLGTKASRRSCRSWWLGANQRGDVWDKRYIRPGKWAFWTLSWRFGSDDFRFQRGNFFGSMLIFQGVGRFLSGGVWMSLLWFLCLIFVEVKYERFLQEA